MSHETSKTKQVISLVFVGTSFVALGAILNAHVPAFHKPVKRADEMLKHGNDTLAKAPVVGMLFKENPLTNNDRIREFVAVNAIETFMVGGTCIAAGSLLKLMGVTPHHLEELLRRFESKHHPPGR